MLPTIALLLSLSSPDVLLLSAPPANPSTPLVASGDDKDDQDKSGKTKDDKGKAKADKSKAKSAGSDQGVGKKVLSFKAKDLDGKEVDFPGDYKGKLVLLDFWATWCGPCMKEMPNVVAAYDSYHEKGFEILGVTLDQQNAVDKIRSVEKEKGMKWPQIYDGGGWKSEVAKKFSVQSIPHAILVDGDTGKILAAGNSLRGEGLKQAIDTALAARSNSGGSKTKDSGDKSKDKGHDKSKSKDAGGSTQH